MYLPGVSSWLAMLLRQIALAVPSNECHRGQDHCQEERPKKSAQHNLLVEREREPELSDDQNHFAGFGPEEAVENGTRIAAASQPQPGERCPGHDVDKTSQQRRVRTVR